MEYIVGESLQSYSQEPEDVVQSVLDCLRDLYDDTGKERKKIISDRQGFWKLHIKLKRPSAEKDNLQVIRNLWKDKFGQVPDSQSATTTENLINWREICQRNLTQQKELTTNLFTNAISPKLEQVYVPLAIVERKPPKPKSTKQPEEAEPETLIPIAIVERKPPEPNPANLLYRRQ